MRANTVTPQAKPSFLSVEKDTGIILRKLFVENNPLSNELKKLLIVNTKDCLDNPKYNSVVENYSLGKLKEDGYITLVPRFQLANHEEVKSYICLTYDSFARTKTNHKFRECLVSFDILCHTDQWDLGDMRVRPLKIAGVIDGILNEARLTGIGQFFFHSCNLLVLSERLAGYTLSFHAIHGNDDKLQPKG